MNNLTPLRFWQLFTKDLKKMTTIHKDDKEILEKMWTIRVERMKTKRMDVFELRIE